MPPPVVALERETWTSVSVTVPPSFLSAPPASSPVAVALPPCSETSLIVTAAWSTATTRAAVPATIVVVRGLAPWIVTSLSATSAPSDSW